MSASKPSDVDHSLAEAGFDNTVTHTDDEEKEE
jgi:hypothetical protein